jgi:DNA primase
VTDDAGGRWLDVTPGGYGPARGGRFGDELLDEIRAKTDIVAVIGEYVQLRKRGGNFIGLCPFHQEKTASFTVTPDKQMFYCFGCQTGGNVFSFLMKREGLSFTEAVEQLAARAGVTIPEKAETRVDPKVRAAAEQRKREMELLHRIVDFASRYFHQALLKSPEAEKARQYLARRGVRPETVEKFRLGYSPRSWTTLVGVLGGKGVDPAVAERAGLALKGRDGHYDRFRGRLMFPIGDQRGQAVGFGARALYEGDEPKYLNSPETPLFSKGRGLYGLHLAAMPIRQKGAALVVEGYMDVIACHEFAFDHAVASMGTALTPDQARAIHRLTSTVVTAFDADAAGTQATLRGLQVLATGGFPVKVAEMPGGKDPDECLRSEGGPEAFRQAVEAAVPLVEYGYALAIRRHDLATIDGRSAISRELLPFLASVDDFAEQQAYVEAFSRRLPVPVSLLRNQLDRFLRQARGPGAGGTSGFSGPGLRDGLSQSRHNEGALGEPGASLPKQLRDAERTLLVHMVSSEESLPHVLEALLEAAQWRRALGLGAEEAAGEASPPVEAEPQFRPDEEPGEAGEPEGDLGVEFAPEGLLPGEDAGPAGDEALGGDEPTTESEVAVLEWFLEPVHRRVARGILSLARAGTVDPARLVDAVPGEVEARFIARVFYETQGASETEWAVRDCLAVLKEHRLNSRIEELHRRISDLESRGAQVEREYTELFRELIDLERHTDGGTGHWKVPGD